MFETTKFRVLEIIIQNRKSSFNSLRVTLMSELSEMSWEEIKSFVFLLSSEGYVAVLCGDDDVKHILIQPTAIARLYNARETVKGEKVKTVIDRILKLVSLL